MPPKSIILYLSTLIRNVSCVFSFGSNLSQVELLLLPVYILRDMQFFCTLKTSENTFARKTA